MKIRINRILPPKHRVKTRPAKSPKNPVTSLNNEVDYRCDQYEGAHKTISEAEKIKREANDKIKELAEKFGTKTGDTTAIETEHFKAGYQEIYAPTLDPVAAKRILSEAVFKKIRHFIPVIDPKIFEQLVDDGTITQKQAAAIIVKGDPMKRISITPKKGRP